MRIVRSLLAATLIVGTSAVVEACGSSDDGASPSSGGSAGTAGAGGSAGGTGGSDAASGTFSISTSDSPISVVQGRSSQVTVQITRTDGFQGSLVVSAEALPAGAHATSAVAAGSSTSATVTVHADTTTQQGATSAKLIALDPDSQEKSEAELKLTVQGIPGSLDTSFGTNGYYEDYSGTLDETASDLLVLADDSVVAAGVHATPGGGAVAIPLFRKLGPDGKLDTTFGDSGKLLLNGVDTKAGIGALLDQGAKGIVAVGFTESKGIFVGRFKPDGSPDPTFGSNGMTFGPQNGTAPVYPQRLLTQTDGKLVAVGHTPSSSTSWDQFVARYTAEGALDTQFGSSGAALIAGSDCETVTNGTIQPDGKIVLVGEHHDCFDTSNSSVLVSRLLPSGQLDSSFGTNGTALFPAGAGGRGYAVHVEASGRLLVATVRYGSPNLLVLKADGTLDDNTGSFGQVYLSLPGGAPRIAQQSDGKLLIATGSVDAVSFARMKSDLTLDTEFGFGGVITNVLPASAASRIAFQSDGRVIVGGTAGKETPSGFKKTFWIGRFWN